MYKALYRKYRPLSFDDVVGQEHITTALKNQVINGTTSHAYLFTGSRGTGKTTCAKILARAINCLNPQNGNPCSECANCTGILNDSVPDVMEIDAASNNGVDYIRELRDRIAFAPAQTKYRVYIIDEVHMLSASASNALLKTLEEPPEHAVFILATTEVNSLLPTILSRCQRYDFHRIEPKVISDRLKYVAQNEKVNLTDDAAMLIAAVADGGMRDALSILDLCVSAGGDITEDTVNSICGRASVDYLFDLAKSIGAGKTAEALETVAKLHSESVDMQRLCSELCEFYRTVTLICAGIPPQKAVASTNSLAEKYKSFSENCGIEAAMRYLRCFNDALSAMNTGNRRSVFEMAIIRVTTPRLDSSKDAILARIAAIERKLVSGQIAVAQSPQKAEINTPEIPAFPQDDEFVPDIPDEPAPDASTIALTAAALKRIDENEIPAGVEEPCPEWNDVVSACFDTAPIMYGLLNESTATVCGDRIIIHSDSSQLRNQLILKNGINYKGLCAAISQVMNRELLPVMEKEVRKSANDPMVNFAERLNNL